MSSAKERVHNYWDMEEKYKFLASLGFLVGVENQ